MGSSFTCKLNPCCGDMRNCDPPPQYSDRYRDEPEAASPAPVAPVASELCSDCPPVGYPTDATRCTPCPRRPAVAPVAVSVKGLEWRNGYRDETVTIYQASFGGLYQVRVIGDSIWLDWPDRGSSVFPTLEAAKAAAQADFDARILSSIIPAKASDAMVETVWGELAKRCSTIPGRDAVRYALEAALSAQDTDGVAKP